MDTKSEGTERVVAQGIQRQKDAESAGFGAFLVVWIVVAVVCFAVAAALALPTIVAGIATLVVATVVAGQASERMKRKRLAD